MTAEKIAITVPSETLKQARRAVDQGRANSLSAYISAAIDQKTMLDDLESMLTEMLEETGGPLRDIEKRRADRALGSTAGPKRGRRAR